MTKLHEVLAVEPDKEGIAKRMIDETRDVFKNKHHIFNGLTKSLKMDTSDESNSSLEEASAEIIEVTTTVPERLAYTESSISDWLDVVLTKEAGNQGEAKADIVIDGETIAADLPATFLLGLEKKLKHIRDMYDSIPTLPPSLVWEKDENAQENVYRSRNDDIKTKTQKRPQFRVLYDATPEHPAQVEKWMEEVVVGRYTTTHQSGMIPAHRKASMMGRLDKLIQAVKQARMRANSVQVENLSVGSKLFDYING